MKVETYLLKTESGKPIRKATKVVFADGTVIRFIDLMSKREAIKQAKYQVVK